jgi:hypothetical protein
VGTHADFSLFELQYADIFTAETFCYEDVLFRRRFVPETFCYRRRFVTETFCYGDVLYGDVLSRRRFVRRRFVCAPTIRGSTYTNLFCDLNLTIFKVQPFCTLPAPPSAGKKQNIASPYFQSIRIVKLFFIAIFISLLKGITSKLYDKIIKTPSKSHETIPLNLK